MKLRSNKRLRLVKPVNITKRVKREKSTQLGALLTDEPAPTVAHVGVDVKSAVPIDGALIHVPVDKPRSDWSGIPANWFDALQTGYDRFLTMCGKECSIYGKWIVKLLKMEYIHNPTLQTEFSNRADKHDSKSNRILSFHGTTIQNANKIQSTGFNTLTVWSSETSDVALGYSIGRSDNVINASAKENTFDLKMLFCVSAINPSTECLDFGDRPQAPVNVFAVNDNKRVLPLAVMSFSITKLRPLLNPHSD